MIYFTKNTLALLLSLALLSACGRKEDGADPAASSADSLTHSLNAALAVVGGVADEEAGESVALPSRSLDLFSKAYAAYCSVRAAQTLCQAGGVKIAMYDGCTVPNTPLAIFGNVRLDYSDPSCNMNGTGDSVTRTFEDLSRESWVGGNVSISSDSHQDYRGESLGGGARIERTADGWNLEILGTRRVHDRGYFDFSLQTPQALRVTGSLSRVNRIVHDGQIDVIHNKAKFVTSYFPKNLHYQAGCCYPVSGTLDIELSGRINKSGSVTFQGCGQAKVERDGETETVELKSCF